MKRISLSKKIIILSLLLLCIVCLIAVGNISASKNNNALVFASANDYDIVKENNVFSANASEISDIESAREKVKNELDDLLSGSYQIEDIAFLQPQVGVDGFYTCKVKLQSGKSVECKLNISSYSAPAVLDFSKPSAISSCVSANAKLTSENGRLKMSCTTTSYDDGFYLYFHTSSMTSENFLAENYRYLKVKYKMTCNLLKPAFQIYNWEDDSQGPTGRIGFSSVNNGSKEGHEITLIIDMFTRDTVSPAITVYDETDGTITYAKLDDVWGEYSGHVETIRFNFARNANYQRTCLVDYVGFFSTLDSAKSYTPISSSFDDYAKTLSTTPLNCLWGDATTEEEAKSTAETLVGNTYGLSCSVLSVSTFIPATETTKGKLVFDGIFKNNGKTEIVSGMTLIINEKPSDCIVLDFSDENLVNKLAFGNIDYEFVNDSYMGDILYMKCTDAEAGDGFFIHAGFGDYEGENSEGCLSIMDSFYLQDYSYVVFRYKRVGIGGGQMFFWTEGLTGDIPYLELYFGKYNGHNYTSILCTDVKDYDNPVIYNYDETTGEIESVLQLSSYGINYSQFSGKVRTIRFNFARKAYLERETWVDYIGFFPTFDEAKEYFASFALNNYSADTLEYFEGNSEDVANRSIASIINGKIGGNFKIEVTKISYTAPVKNVSNGQYKITAKIKIGDEVLFTTNQITYTINNKVNSEEKDYIFSNPYLIREIFGSNIKSVNFEKMTLTDILPKFTYTVSGDTFFTEEKPYVAVKLNGNASDFTFTVNNSSYKYNSSISGENIFVYDLFTGDIYKNGIKVETVATSNLFGRVESFGFAFNTLENIDIYSVSFFSTLESAKAFTGVFNDSALTSFASGLQSQVTAKGNITAVNEITAVKQAQKIIGELVGTSYTVYDVETMEYISPSTISTGSIKVKAIIYSGDKYRSIFSQVELSFVINKTTAESNNGQSVVENGVLDITDSSNENNVKWYNIAEKGHIFNGNDGVAVLSPVEKTTTIEWWMKIAETTGTYTILSNGSSLNIAVIAGNLDYKNNDVTFTTSGITICDNQMKHYAVVVSGSTYLYIDGVLVGTFDGGSAITSTKLYIGCEKFGSKEVTNGFVGEVADVRIWNYARTSQEILNNKSNTLNGNENGLVGYWKLDEQYYLNDLTENFVAGTTNGNKYPEAEEYFANCMGYKDYTANGNHGVFFSSGWYNLENIITDYTIIQISDTQSYMFGHPEYFDDMYSWMADSKEDLNIVMVDHLGDVCQDSTALQWGFTYDVFVKYLQNSIPFNIALGNHDYFSPYTGIGSEFRDKEYFVEKFPIDVVKEQFEGIDWARYGGSYDNYNADNMYMYFEAGDPKIEYMVIILEYGPRQEVINWASELVEKNSDHKVFILTHCYYDMYGTRSTFNTRRTTAFSDAFEGTDIWNEFIDKYDNIVMVNCGHSQNNSVQAYVNTTSKGTEVVQILSDPSAMVTGFPSDEGIIELMCFTNEGKMHTYYYSPVTKMFRETQFECTFDMADALGLND